MGYLTTNTITDKNSRELNKFFNAYNNGNYILKAMSMLIFIP